MGFNYGLEKKKFDQEWVKLRREYRAAGMDEASIEAMYAFDWKGFNAERAYQNHTQRMPFQQFNDDGDTAGDDASALLVKFLDAFAVMPQETDESNRYGWMDEVESEVLYASLQKLSDDDIDLLTLYVFEGFSVVEIAAMKGIAHQNVSKKIRRIKKFLKNF